MNAFNSKLAALSAVTLLAACAGVPMTNGTSPAHDPIAKLQSGEWVVQSINRKAVDTQHKPTLNFSQTFQLTGHASCNTYFAGYHLTGPSIEVKQAGTTRKACDPALMAQEQRFMKQLTATQMWNIDNSGTLTLAGASGVMIAKRK